MAFFRHRFGRGRGVKVIGAVMLIGIAGTLGQARAESVQTQFAPAAQTGARAPETATQVIDRFHGVLLNVMRDAKTLGYDGRYKLLDPAIRASFNLDVMAQIVSGSFWGELDPAAKARLVDGFGRMTIASYAARFDGYDGENFETLADETAPRDGRLVKTRLVRVGEEPVNFNYMLRQYDGDWRVIDIYLNGTFSEMATKRSEYTSVLKNQGFDVLMARLESRVADLASGKK